MTKFQTVYGVRLYPIEYLMNEDLTDSDLNHLIGENTKSFKYSLIIGMLRYIGVSKRNSDIIKQITSDSKWIYKYNWKVEQCQEYENMVKRIYKNIFSYSDKIALQYAQWFISIYGITIKGNTVEL